MLPHFLESSTNQQADWSLTISTTDPFREFQGLFILNYTDYIKRPALFHYLYDKHK